MGAFMPCEIDASLKTATYRAPPPDGGDRFHALILPIPGANYSVSPIAVAYWG
jgi:hypothetical protein